VFQSLPSYSQHLLVLLFGTFRVIHGNSESAKTGMTAEALGVSVAPSFFQTCVTEGKIAKPDEVQKFKVFKRQKFISFLKKLIRPCRYLELLEYKCKNKL
jgi:hypothetical protein